MKKAVKDMLLQKVLFEISLRMQFKAAARRGTTNIGKIYSHQMLIKRADLVSHSLLVFPLSQACLPDGVVTLSFIYSLWC
jgi:hypothetical protein